MPPREKTLKERLAEKAAQREAMRARVKGKKDAPGTSAEPAQASGKDSETELKKKELDARISEAMQKIAEADAAKEESRLRIKEADVRIGELELEVKAARTRLESAERMRVLEERKAAEAKIRLAQVEQALAQAKTDQAKAEARAAQAERELHRARSQENADEEKRDYEMQDAADFVGKGYSRDAKAFRLRDGIGTVVNYINNMPLEVSIESILNSTRGYEVGSKQVKIRAGDEIRIVLGHIGVKEGINPFDADTVFSLLPRELVDSVGKAGGFGTDFIAKKSPTIVITMDGVAEFVLQKGKSKDGLVLQHRGEHIAILDDYPDITREMARNYASMR